MAEKHIIKYPNGATLIYYQQNVNSTTDITVGFLGGASLDGKKLGLAHALEHSFFLGTESMTKEEMYDYFKQTGTIYNAFTTQDCIATTFNCPSSCFEKVSKINSEMLYNRDISEKELEREKKVILQELYMTLDNDESTGLEFLIDGKSLKKGKDILGDAHTLNSITPKDFKEFKENYFITDNMVISVVSSLPYEQVKPIIERDFINKFPQNTKNKVKPKNIKYKFENKQFLIDVPDKNSFMLYFMFKGLKNAEKNELYSHFENWYFNNFGGELLKKLRLENPYVYTASFGNIKLTKFNLKDFYILTSPENVNSCILEFTKILRNLVYNGITEDEYKRFQQTMIAERERKTNIKSHSATNLFYNYIYGEKPFVKSFYQKLLAITRDDINNYLRDIYGNGELIVECVGDIYRAENKFVLQEYPGYSVLSNRALLALLLEKISQETPIYRIDEILSQFSLKYKFDQGQVQEHDEENPGVMNLFINYLNNSAYDITKLTKLKLNTSKKGLPFDVKKLSKKEDAEDSKEPELTYTKKM